MSVQLRFSVSAFLISAFLLPAPLWAESFDNDPEIEAGAASNNNSNNVTINNQRIFELSNGDGNCHDNGRTAVLSEVESTNITIGNNGVLEINDDGCTSSSGTFNAIRVGNGAEGRITINGRVSVPDAISNALLIEDSMGTTDTTIGRGGQVDGAISIGQGGDHEVTNNGTINGAVLFADSGAVAGAAQLFTNNGTLTATIDNRAVLIDNTSHNITTAEDGTFMARSFTVALINADQITGDIDIGASGAHTVQNRAGAVIDGMVTFQGGTTPPLEAVGGTYQNLGTHNAGNFAHEAVEDFLAIHVEGDRAGQNTSTGLCTDFTASVKGGVCIDNTFGARINGSVLIEGDGSDGYTNGGILNGRVRFIGDGGNTANLTGGEIFLPGNTALALVDTGNGDDILTLSGTTISPAQIDDEAEEQPETVEMTLIDLGDGDDRATLSSGRLLGATTALQAGAGNDRVIYAPSPGATLEIEGEVDGGTGTDTLEARGGVDGSVTTLTGAIAFDNFENFDVTQGNVALDFSEGGALFVLGGSLNIAEGAALDLGTSGSISSDNGQSIAHFKLTSGRNDGTLIFREDTQLHDESSSAGFISGEAASMLFAVATQIQEDGAIIISNSGRFFDPNSYQSFGQSSAAGVVAEEGARLVLERGTSLGLGLDTNSLATDLNPNADFFAPVAIPVITSAGLVVSDGASADPSQSDVVVSNVGHLNDVVLIDENPFYDFEFQVQNTGSQTIISIVASRTPGLEQTLRDAGFDRGAGGLLDDVFDMANAAGCQNNANVDPALCALDSAVRALAPRSAQVINLGVRALEPNRHSGLWQGLLANQQMTLGTVSLRSATVRADAGGMAAPTQYALINDPAKNPELGAIAMREGISGVNAGNIWEANRFWIQAFGGLADRERSDNDVGHETGNVGVVFGYDRRITRTGLIGIFGSYGAADVESKGADGEEITINAFNGGLYYTTFNRTASAEFSLAGGVSQMEGERSPLGGGRAAYDADGWHLSFRAAADTNMKAQRLLITPNAAMQYTFMNQGGYDETGTSPSLLSVDSINMHSLETTLGANVGLPSRLGKLAALPKFKFAWMHEFLDDTSSVDARLINIPAAGVFTSAAVKVPADRVTAGLGLDLASRGGTTFTVGYDFTLGSDYMAHTGAATFRFPF